MSFEIIHHGIIKFIEFIMLLSILLELLFLLFKIIKKDEGKPLLVMIMLSTISIRDIMLMIEGVKTINLDVLYVEVICIFLTFILVNIKTYFTKTYSE